MREILPHPGYEWLVAPEMASKDARGEGWRWYAYEPAGYLEPTERFTGVAPTQVEATEEAEQALSNL